MKVYQFFLFLKNKLLPNIPVDLQETVQRQLLDKIYGILFFHGMFMPLFIMLRFFSMYEKFPIDKQWLLWAWSIATVLPFLATFPLWFYYRKEQREKNKQYRKSVRYWYRYLLLFAVVASLSFAMSPWLMYEYLSSHEIIIFTAFLSLGIVVIPVVALSGFISLWLSVTLPILISVSFYNCFYWDFDRELGRLFTVWLLISVLYTFFIVLQRNKTQVNLLLLRLRLADANNAKSRFLSVMSHEIRTPLSSIIGMTNLLSEENLNKQQRFYTDNIRSAGNNLLHVLNNVLLVSSSQSAQPVLHEENFNLRELIDDLVQCFHMDAQQKGLDLQWQVNNTIPSICYGDAARLRQILLNLLSNAIKFTHQGEIRLVVKLAQHHTGENTDRQTDKQTNHFHFSVYDTGIGIDEASKSLIFNEFSQITPLKHHNFEGVGLGLTIVAELVRLLKGRLYFDSEIGKGSCFHIELPFAEQKREAQTVRIELNEFEYTPLQLILVEDDDLNREITTKLLRRYGKHHVYEARNAEQALVLLKQHKIQLLITDLNLPQMSGIQLTQRLQQTHPDLPIIALTADATDEMNLRCLEAGMSVVLTKPIDTKRLQHILLAEATRSTPVKQEQNIFSTKVIYELLAVMSYDEVRSLFLRSFTTIQTELEILFKQFLQIPESDRDKNKAAWITQLHRLIGACANLGCAALAQQLKQIENNLAHSDKQYDKQLIDCLPLLLQTTEQALNDFLVSIK